MLTSPAPSRRRMRAGSKRMGRAMSSSQRVGVLRERTVTHARHREKANGILGHRKSRSLLREAHTHPASSASMRCSGKWGVVACLSPEERLGGRRQRWQRHPRRSEVPRTSRASARHLVDAGEVDEEALQGIIHCAHAASCQPTHGGGTRPDRQPSGRFGLVVTSWPRPRRPGLRALHRPSYGVSVCRGRRRVQARCACPYGRALLRLDASDRDPRRPVLWSSTLQPLMDRVITLTDLADD